MSSFIDRLKQASQAEHPPMGFKAAKKTFEKRRMLLVAEVKESVAAGVLEGADAVLLQGTVKNPPEKTDLPLGIKLSGGKAGKMEGIDYVVFTPETPITIARDEKTGKIMAVDASLEMGLLRALEDLPLDALFIISDGAQVQVVTWQYLMLCKRFSTISGKPVLILVSPQISSNELQMLWEAGAAGVVVEVKTGEEIKKLRCIIDSLKPPSQKKRAIVPPLREEATPIIREEEEEED